MLVSEGLPDRGRGFETDGCDGPAFVPYDCCQQWQQRALRRTRLQPRLDDVEGEHTGPPCARALPSAKGGATEVASKATR